jgi:hypothetical protein
MAIQKGDGMAIHVIERQRNNGRAMRANENDGITKAQGRIHVAAIDA